MGSLEDNFKQLARDLSTMMDEMRNENFFRFSGLDSWEPAVNIYESPDRVFICIELAGLRKTRLDVKVEGQHLHLRGIRPKPRIPELGDDVCVHLMEIDSGKLNRRIPLPPGLDVTDSEVRYEDGFLWIVLPKAG